MRLTLIFLLTSISLVGCVTDPLQKARIDTCSREANAFTPGSRIGNSAYWSCLNREEARQNAPKPIITQAQQRSTAISSQLKTSNQAVESCSIKAYESPSGQAVMRSILVLKDDQPNKFDLLGSKARLNEAQKKSLKGFLTEIAPCRKIALDGSSGLSIQPVIARNYAARDVIYTRLLTGQTSIGEANLAMQQQRIKFNEERKAEFDKITQDLKNQNAAEVQNIQRQRQSQIENQQRQQLIELKQRQADLEAYRTFTAPPPATNLTPGLTRGNQMDCMPDGRGGYNCR
jgi:hypothetical protein